MATSAQWQAMICRRKRNSECFICGGVLIKKRPCAHGCAMFLNMFFPSEHDFVRNVVVKVGKRWAARSEPFEQVRSIDQVCTHQSYDPAGLPSNSTNDTVLIRLKRGVPVTADMRQHVSLSARLPKKDTLACLKRLGTPAPVSGPGQTSSFPHVPVSSHLLWGFPLCL